MYLLVICSYCPAKARDFGEADDEVLVKFYDGVKAKVALSEVFPIPSEKHAADIQYIVCKETELIGKQVVAWNERRRIFELGQCCVTLICKKVLTQYRVGQKKLHISICLMLN